MFLVIDTNSIISALIKDGISRSIIFNNKFKFITPAYTITEIAEYREEICLKGNFSEKEFIMILLILFNRIKIVPEVSYEKFLSGASKLIEDIKDVPFIALTLASNAEGIWTDDKHFQKQKKIKIYTTKDLLELV